MGHYCRIYHFITIGILLTSTIFQISVFIAADEITTTEIEAKAVNASFSIDEEVVIQWENIQTNSATLIDELKESKYSIYRSAESFSTVDLESIEPLISDIRACESNETNVNCSGKSHTYAWNPPIGTNGSYFYGVSTQVYSDGNYSTIFNYQNSSISEAISEYVKPHWGPVDLQADFIQSKSATKLSWINPADVDEYIPTNHTTWIWRHSELATRSNWDQMNKELIASFLLSSTSSYEVQHNSPIEEYNYYTVTYSFDEMSYVDERFLGTNTLFVPILEDNVAPTLVGLLSASNSDGITHLSWQSAISETDLIARIWRSSQIIQNLDSLDVQSVGFVNGQISNWDFQIPIEEHGEFWYAVTLEDELGNRITEIESVHPMTGPVFEHTLTNNFVPNNLQVTTLPGGITEISWDGVPAVREVSYHIWRSFNNEITSISDSDVEYIDSISESNSYVIQSDIDFERSAWYAVTIEGIWGTSSQLYNETSIQLGNNSIETSVYEDTLAPLQVEDLNASYDHESGNVSISWTPAISAINHSIWILDSDIGLGPEWDITSDNWTLLATIPITNSAFFEHTPLVFEQHVLYAITATDEVGNTRLLLTGSGPVEAVLITNITNETRICLDCCGDLYEIPSTSTCPSCTTICPESSGENGSSSENENSTTNTSEDESVSSGNSLDNILMLSTFLLVLYILIIMGRRKNKSFDAMQSSPEDT